MNEKFSDLGLPTEVKYCTKCVESNQRMMGSVQHKDTVVSKKDTIIFDDNGVCSGCQYHEFKKTIDWNAREEELKVLLDKHRRNDGYYDVLVPGSGGKDSIFASHILKYKYGMNPLTVTWSPHLYTDIGWKNFQAWIRSGFDNVLFTPDGKIHRALTRLAFLNLLHPFQPFVFGQYYYPQRMAIEKNIKLIMYADSYAERGAGSKIKWSGNQLDPALFTREKDQKIFLGGVALDELRKHGIEKKDLNPYLPIEKEIAMKHGAETYMLPYFLPYDPQKQYYYAVEHTDFETNPDGRSEGTYTKYSSLDDKIDGFHYFTWFIKTGRGRTTEDASLEIRNKHITRDEGIALVRRFDGEFPKKYFKEFLDYTGITENEFWDTIDKFRPSHLWKKENGEWKLKQQVN